MTSGQQSIESAIAGANSLHKVLKGHGSNQVTSEDEKQIIKATAHAWFNNNRTAIASLLGEDQLKPVDDLYRLLLTCAGRATLRTKYFELIKQLRKKLSALLADHAILLSKEPQMPGSVAATTDSPPKFSPLISDPKMQAILEERWLECVICIKSGAPLAATVMMGGILEGLLLARILQLSNMAPVFTANLAPKDKSGKTLPLKEWGLKNFIDVGHELGWITTTAKDIGEVLRDYRNYIHPQKELSHGISLLPSDAEMLWNIAKSIAVQVLKP
ncbi:MAG: hypothetical protein P4L40_21675 [Terracidiphilus sp.]|nr:hypothetical protein [Terracidiphilus sp.]